MNNLEFWEKVCITEVNAAIFTKNIIDVIIYKVKNMGKKVLERVWNKYFSKSLCIVIPYNYHYSKFFKIVNKNVSNINTRSNPSVKNGINGISKACLSSLILFCISVDY